MILFDTISTKLWSLFFPKELIFGIPVNSNRLFLTFDDGPHPEVTPFVLDTLKKFDAKATFFCLGKNAEQYPEIVQRIKDEGHSLGNHTYSHLNGWKTNAEVYVQDVQRADLVLRSRFFRPPYGRLSPSQIRLLKEKFSIIMWDVLTYDYNKEIPVSRLLKHIKRNTKKGSLVVFHDSLKAQKKLEFLLPETLEHFSKLDFTFSGLNESSRV